MNRWLGGLLCLLLSLLLTDAAWARRCRRPKTLSERVTCVYLSRHTKAIQQLVSIGLSAARTEDQLSPQLSGDSWDAFSSSAQYAARLALERRDAGAYKNFFSLATDPDPIKKLFGLKALTHFLEYLHENPQFKEKKSEELPDVREGEILSLCQAQIAAGSVLVLSEVVHCLSHGEAASAVEMILSVWKQQTDLGVRSQCLQALRSFPSLEQQRQEVLTLSEELMKPLSSDARDVELRAELCHLLTGLVVAEDEKLREQALDISKRLKIVNPEAEYACVVLARQAGPVEGRRTLGSH